MGVFVFNDGFLLSRFGFFDEDLLRSPTELLRRCTDPRDRWGLPTEQRPGKKLAASKCKVNIEDSTSEGLFVCPHFKSIKYPTSASDGLEKF